MALRWMMMAALLLVCPPKGRAEPLATIAVRSVAEGVAVHCRLLGDERLGQINWVASSGPNTTGLATYHPVHGPFVPPALRDSVAVQNAGEADRDYGIVLTGGAVGENSSVCCTFNTFPSGVFQKCVETSVIAEALKADALVEDEEKVRAVEQWSLMVVCFLICFLSVIFSVVHCWRNCCRRKVFEVRYVIDHNIDTENNTDASIQQHPLPATPSGILQEPKSQDQPKVKPRGFDPSKLYAKIKLDLLYGRLWKSYQGPPRPWTPSPPPPPPPPPALPSEETPQRVYSFLGEHGTVLFPEELPDSQPLSPSLGPVHQPSPQPQPATPARDPSPLL